MSRRHNNKRSMGAEEKEDDEKLTKKEIKRRKKELKRERYAQIKQEMSKLKHVKVVAKPVVPATPMFFCSEDFEEEVKRIIGDNNLEQNTDKEST